MENFFFFFNFQFEISCLFACVGSQTLEEYNNGILNMLIWLVVIVSDEK